jgi:uncharacterized RDD family membrane protein YckC
MITSGRTRPILWACLSVGAFLVLLGVAIVVSGLSGFSSAPYLMGSWIGVMVLVVGFVTVLIGAILSVWSWQKRSPRLS